MTIKSSLLIALIIHAVLFALPGLKMDAHEKAQAKSMGVVISSGGSLSASAKQGCGPQAAKQASRARTDGEEVHLAQTVAQKEPVKPSSKPKPVSRPEPRGVAVKTSPRAEAQNTAGAPAVREKAGPRQVRPEEQKEAAKNPNAECKPREPIPGPPERELVEDLAERAPGAAFPEGDPALGRDAATAGHGSKDGPGADGPPRFGLGDLNGPVVTVRPELRYPSRARRMGVEGVVLVEALIDEEGRVLKARVVNGPGLGLDRAAREFVLECRFKPARQQGQPIACIAEIPIRFNLR